MAYSANHCRKSGSVRETLGIAVKIWRRRNKLKGNPQTVVGLKRFLKWMWFLGYLLAEAAGPLSHLSVLVAPPVPQPASGWHFHPPIGLRKKPSLASTGICFGRGGGGGGSKTEAGCFETVRTRCSLWTFMSRASGFLALVRVRSSAAASLNRC